ncbi:hypothetical protein [Polaribacter sp. Hel1_85]|uniref:hypothetical protein n=1 Tax=Polaribacter sp. Hel1_85 TaxID=1250005 RepID=UPI00052BEC3A|nr:hypothetical protein [Polaribacter sp. Hel1_85]KGL59130.1 hypothetical protein PHEL85_3404 [Polaribacter sp. Hel1_85]
MRKIILFLCFMFSCSLAFSQLKKKEKLSKKQLSEYKIDYSNKMELLNLKHSADYFFDNNVNVYKYNELKSKGVDLIQVDKSTERTYKSAILFSNTQIKGTVVKRVYLDDKDSFFRTEISIKVDKSYYGTNLKKGEIIKLKLQSGKIGDDFLKVSNEPDLFLGESVILYLTSTDSEKFKKSLEGINEFNKNYKLKGNKDLNIIYSKKNSKVSNSFVLYKKYTVKNNIVFNKNKRKIGSLDEVENNIELISKINRL